MSHQKVQGGFDAGQKVMVPLRESLKELISIDTYSLEAERFQDAFSTYDSQLSTVFVIISTLVGLRVAYNTFKMEGVGSFFKVIQDALICYFWIWFFPDFFRYMLQVVDQLQHAVITASLPASVESKAALSTQVSSWSTAAVGIGLNFLGPVGWFLSLCLTIVLFIPKIISYLYGSAFVLGIDLLIIMAPSIIVGSTLCGIGFALKAFMWMLMSLLMWPFLWSAIGRLALMKLGNGSEGLVRAAVDTVILGLMQGGAPIILMWLTAGKNPGQALASTFGRVIGGLGGVSVGTLTAPVLGASAAFQELRGLSKRLEPVSPLTIGPAGSGSTLTPRNPLGVNQIKAPLQSLKPIANDSHSNEASDSWKKLTPRQFIKAGMDQTGSTIEAKTKEAILSLGKRAQAFTKNPKKGDPKQGSTSLGSRAFEDTNSKQRALPKPDPSYIPPSSSVFGGKAIHLGNGKKSENQPFRTMSFDSDHPKAANFMKSLGKKFDLKPIPRFASKGGEIQELGQIKKGDGSEPLSMTQNGQVFGVYSKKSGQLKSVLEFKKKFQTPGSSSHTSENSSGKINSSGEKYYYYNPNKVSAQTIIARRFTSPGFEVNTYQGPIPGCKDQDGTWIDISSSETGERLAAYIPNQSIKDPFSELEINPAKNEREES